MKSALLLAAAALFSPTLSAAQFVVPTRPISLPSISVPLNLPATMPAPSLPLVQVPVLITALPVVEAYLAPAVPAHAAAVIPAIAPIDLPAPSAHWRREDLNLPGPAAAPVRFLPAQAAARRALPSLRRIGGHAAAAEFDGLPFADAIVVP
jgi:hypothetical protein